jgi:hypothetical protein
LRVIGNARAFAAVMQHLRSIDKAERTVILMQVENETGFPAKRTRLFRLQALEI